MALCTGKNERNGLVWMFRKNIQKKIPKIGLRKLVVLFQIDKRSMASGKYFSLDRQRN